MTSKSSIAAKALLSLQTGGMYNGIWLSDETVTREINKTYSAIKKTGGISRTDLNQAAGPRGAGALKQCRIFGKDNKTAINYFPALQSSQDVCICDKNFAHFCRVTQVIFFEMVWYEMYMIHC